MVAFGRRGEPAPSAPTKSVESADPAFARGEHVAACPKLSLATRLDSSRARLDRRIARLAADVRERTGRTVRLAPLLIIPETCWRGRHGKFLLHALALNPYDEWNVAVLPVGPGDVAGLDAPVHPGEPGPREIGAVNEMLAALRHDYAEAMEQMEWTADRADIENAHARALESVKSFAATQMRALFGEPEDDAQARQLVDDAAS